LLGNEDCANKGSASPNTASSHEIKSANIAPTARNAPDRRRVQTMVPLLLESWFMTVRFLDGHHSGVFLDWYYCWTF
jgi:hypothetical protein